MLSGSAKAKYRPKIVRELGIGASIYHSITALEAYENLSNEEIRIEDYKASDGLFGSAIAKIGAALCVEPKYKPKPYLLGKLYRAAQSASKPTESEEEKQSKKSNSIKVVIVGKNCFKVSVNGPGLADFNLLIKDESATEKNKPEPEPLGAHLREYLPLEQPMHSYDYSHPYGTRKALSNLKTMKNLGSEEGERKFSTCKDIGKEKENLKNSSQSKEGRQNIKQEHIPRRRKK